MKLKNVQDTLRLDATSNTIEQTRVDLPYTPPRCGILRGESDRPHASERLPNDV